MPNYNERTSEFRDNYRYAHDYWAPYISNAQLTTLAASGYTWSDSERQELIKEGREPIEFNIMRRDLQFFSGYLRDNLNSIVIAPVEGSDQKTADQFTKLQYYVWDKGQGTNTFLDSCDEAFKSGMSLCGIQMDYSKDFINGDISFYKRTYNSFYLDPTFERIDLKDCAFAITRDLIDRNYTKQLLRFVDPKQIDDIPIGFRDDKFLSFHPNFTTLSRNKNLVAYDQYYVKVSKKRKFLVDNVTGYFRDVTDLDKEESDKLKIGIKRIETLNSLSDESEEEMSFQEKEKAGVPHKVHFEEVERPFVDLCIYLNGVEVYQGEDRTGINQTYPFVVNMCYLEPSIWMPSQRVQGISQTLWSNQRQFNKGHMKIIDMMNSEISTGFKYFIGAVPDVTDLQQSGQNKLIGVDPDPTKAPAGLDSVVQLQGGNANSSIIQYQQVLDQLMLSLGNINESVLGIDDKGNTQISGRLAQVRIAQGLRGNRKIFDNVEIAQQILGGLVLKAIQNHYPAGKVERILGEKPTDQFYEKEFEQYDAVVKEGVRSQSQRDAYYYELVNLKREQIVDVPEPEIIRAMQMAGMSDLQLAIEEQSKQKAEQAQDTQKKADELVQASTEEKLGLAAERRGRLISNLGLNASREAEAERSRAEATLARAKTITEVAAMNEDRILKVLEYITTLDNQERENEAKEKANVDTQAASIESSVKSTEEQMPMQQMQGAGLQ